MSPEDLRSTIAQRFDEVGIEPERFVQCHSGEKRPINHSTYAHDIVEGNYGIYAESSDALVLVDVDDYDRVDDKSGLTALTKLPATLEQGSPHGGTHRLFVVRTDDERAVAKVLEDEIGKENPAPTWGEVRVANQYIVGAGSQLDGCDKDWCDECDTDDGGRYELEHDREIAEIDVELLLEVLRADPTYNEDEEESTDAEEMSVHDGGRGVGDVDVDALLAHAREQDDKLDDLWRGNTSDFGGDRSKAECALAAKLAFWFHDSEQIVKGLLDRSNTEKWGEREDGSYRDSVLEGIGENQEHYSGIDRFRDDESNVVEKRDVGSSDDDDSEPETRELTEPRMLDLYRGSYGNWKYYEDDDGEDQRRFDEVTNFQIAANSYLETPDGDTVIDMTVYPSHDEEPYDVAAEPKVFNEKRKFAENVVTGLTTTFSGGQDALNNLRQFVGTQDAPHLDGVNHIGLHGDEWVTPSGNITTDGWVGAGDDREHVFVERDLAIERKWQLDAEMGDSPDMEQVRNILELIPQTRDSTRFAPVLGWFYAAACRPLIHQWTGQFNLLSVTGETGSGKTASLSTLWKMLGMDGDPLSANDTAFSILTTLGSSNAVPMWYDEYKPSDMSDYKIDTLHEYVRKSTRGGSEQRGNADQSTTQYRLHAPVVVSGEERMHGSAEERRGVFTSLKASTTDPRSETARAFSELTGKSFTTENGETVRYDGYDLSQHALAYYQHLLGRDEADLKEMWHEAGEHVAKTLAEIGVEGLEDLVEQGMQTVVFGIRLYEAFAEAVGADTGLVAGDGALDGVIEYLATETYSGANRTNHLDTFFEVAARAAKADYLEEGEHYTFIREGEVNEELRVHLPSAYDQVARYARDHEVSEDLLNSKDDYYERIDEELGKEEGYVVIKNQNTTGLNRCLGLHMGRMVEALDDVEKGMFTDVVGSEDDDGTDDSPLNSLDPGYHTITVTCLTSTTDTPEMIAEQGVLKDSTETVDYVVWSRTSDTVGLEEDQSYRIHDAKVTYDQNGAIQIELDDSVCSIEEIETGVGYTGPASSGPNQSLDAVTDGGAATRMDSYYDESPKTSRRIESIVRHEGPCSKEEVIQIATENGISGEDAGEALEGLRAQGDIAEHDGEWEVNQ